MSCLRAVLSAALLWKNLQAFSLVLRNATMFQFLLIGWFDFNFSLTLKWFYWLQTKKLFPTGLFGFIRYTSLSSYICSWPSNLWVFIIILSSESSFGFCLCKCCNAVLLFICDILWRKSATKEVEDVFLNHQ